MRTIRQATVAGLALLAALAVLPARASVTGDRATYAADLRAEALKAGLPFDIADAVVAVESGYDPTKIGGVGEIGLMQVRPATAAMLGFKGDVGELAKPAVNIHYGVSYLAEAWRQADGDLCRALMKYRAGHGEEVMTALSVTYCRRARAHLAAVGSSYASAVVPAAVAAEPLRSVSSGLIRDRPLQSPLLRLSGAAFWAAHKARIAVLNAQVERRWRRMASR